MKDLLKYNILGYIIVMFLIFSISSCFDCEDPNDKECSNYDPCHEGVDPPVAYFGAGHIVKAGQNSHVFFKDTTVYLDGDSIPNYCTFFAYSEDVDSFYWKVGDDPSVFRTRKFALNFSGLDHLTGVDVELQVLKKNECFEGGFFRDTIQRRLFILNDGLNTNDSNTYFNSTYKGISTEYPMDSFEIIIKDEFEQIENMPRGKEGKTSLYRRNYDKLFIFGGEGSTMWLGSISIMKDDRRRIIIRYKVSYDVGETQSWYTYTGIRVD